MNITFDIPEEEDFWLDSDDVISDNRPIFTGDIYAGISIPGLPSDPKPLSALVAHPCSMRNGVDLKPRLLSARVLAQPDQPLDRYRDGHYSKYPVPSIGASYQNGPYVIKLDDIGVVTPSDLENATRIACMTEKSVVAFQQRLIFFLTRELTPTSRILEAMKPQLEEAELFEEWNESLVDATRSSKTMSVSDALEQLAAEFNHLLGDPSDPSSLRHKLGKTIEIPSVRKEIRKKRDEKLASLSST